MQGIPAALGDHVDQPAARMGELGAEVARLHFVLIDKVNAGEVSRSRKRRLGIDSAIPKKHVLVGARSIDRNNLVKFSFSSRKMTSAVQRH